MAATVRLGTMLILAGALGLTGLMAYTLLGVERAPDVRPHGPASPPEVVAVFPELADWREFCQGVISCERIGRLRLLGEEEDSITVATPRLGRVVRFVWAPARGEIETRREVRRRVESPTPPLAFVGSTNTALTAALADELHSTTASFGRDAPVLLIPWATAVHASPGEGRKPSPLLEINPGRSFRFCPNDRSEAEMVVDCVAASENARPARVFLVVDPDDPYSVDLADYFGKAITTLAPNAGLMAFRDVVIHAGPDDRPTPEDLNWAAGIVKALESPGAGQRSWIVLPLQAEPTRRLLRALREVLPRGAGPVQVLCGDGIGLESLAEFSGVHSLSIWCATAATHPSPLGDPSPDVQVTAEIVSTLIAAMDEAVPPTRESIRVALAKLDLPADHPASLGRSLAFSADGERRGEDLGRVFHVGPSRGEILSFARERPGKWSAPTTITSPPHEARQ